jgi:HSP20 family molecular chaperone IbpA
MNDQAVTRPATPRVERRRPEVEIVEDDQALWVSADVPGVEPGQVDVSFDQGVLTLTARAEAPRADGALTTEFTRRFTLCEPSRYDAEQINATLRNGVLELRLPKAERARRRQIPVSVN